MLTAAADDDGTVQTYVCEFCGGVDDLLALARKQLRATRRTLTTLERRTYLDDRP